MEKKLEQIPQDIPVEQRIIKAQAIQRGYEKSIEDREKEIEQVRERYQPEIGRIQERYQPEIRRLGRAMERAEPVGTQFMRPFRQVQEMGGRVVGVTGEAKDITVQTLEKELTQAQRAMFAREEAGGKPEL